MKVKVYGSGKEKTVGTIAFFELTVGSLTEAILESMRETPHIHKMSVNNMIGSNLRDYFEYVRSLELRLREIEECLPVAI